ncbi:hypothetical protein ACHAWF_002879 [Thalassiosira exigua]
MTSGSAPPRTPLFEGLSPEEPRVLTVSFASDPSASLGVQLCDHDNGLTNEMFLPGYASVGGMAEGDTLARRCGVRLGDVIVAVCGEGHRRYPPDFREEDLEDVTRGTDLIALDSPRKGGGDEEEDREERERRARERRGRVATSKKGGGEAYGALLARIREVKSNPSPDHPLSVSMERHGWDSRAHAWSRFLSARNGNVPAATTMIQAHDRWRAEFFPVDLTEASLQRVMKARAVSEIDVGRGEGGEGVENGGENGGSNAPVVYIDFAKLQEMGAESETLGDDVVKAFVVYTETLLSRSPDPRSPKTSQFVDLSGVRLREGLQSEVLRRLYATFEPNYPETLERMVLYPVPRIMVRAVNAMLSFVNEHTRKKFVITDDLFVVCKGETLFAHLRVVNREIIACRDRRRFFFRLNDLRTSELGWNLKEIETCGSVNGYMKKHLKHGLSFVFD